MAITKKSVALDMAHAYWPSFRAARDTAILTDQWIRGEQYEIEVDAENRYHGQPYAPKAETTDEYDDLSSRTPTPWGGLVVTSLAQTAYVDGVRRPGVDDNLEVWADWQRNRMDSKQNAIHRAAIGLSTAYGIVLPGKDPLTGDKMAKMLARSPKQMSAFYDNDDDEWATLAIEAEADKDALGIHKGWYVKLYDSMVTHRLYAKAEGRDRDEWLYLDYVEHGFPVPPVARCVNRLDLDGRATGEIEPILPMLRRIDQDMFDRLIVQRFGAWKVRYISGMAKPSSTQAALLQAMRLRVEDLLISENKDTKFGTLEHTPLDGFIAASDADLRMLAAITQTPPHHLLGLSSNLQAEALAAAESGLQRKSVDFRMNAGEFHEQMFRMAAWVRGDKATAQAYDLQVRWRDTESRSLTQAADALGKLAVQLKVPLEMLWEKVPGWTDGDTERAKALVESGAVEALLQEMLGNEPGAEGQPNGNV